MEAGKAQLELVGSRTSHTSDAHTNPFTCCRKRAPRDFKGVAAVPGRDMVGFVPPSPSPCSHPSLLPATALLCRAISAKGHL